PLNYKNKHPMKILELNTECGWRGGERQTLYAMQGLSAAGVQATLLATAGEPLAQATAKEGLPVQAMKGFWAALRFLIRQGRQYDLLHAQTSQDQTLALLSKPFHGRPIVYSRRVDFVPKPGLSRWKYHQMDAVVAISPAIQQIM